ncbi:transmembrane protein 249-like [Alosa sapidissima]|uniref:transmembrane protein 249-like n=1 Tax=Alosa sapidissima TaxID=34773 RepID=UPI001C09DC61|nr:transmembrane protein 249-like [Alosa sapidissima]XP_041933649.1 transmembrane protein 249-like [Alosa sapidissima]
MTIGIFNKYRDKLFVTNQAFTSKILQNPSFPFIKKDDVFVYEYFHESLLNGALLLLASTIGMAVYVTVDSVAAHSYISFFVFSMGVSLWLISSGACRRRLVIDHSKKEYRFYIHTHLRHRGPLNQIYIRIITQKTGAQGTLMYRLILNGYKIDCHALCGFSEKYRLLECQGKTIASNLQLNYFDYLESSKRHFVIHRPFRPKPSNVKF